MGQRLRGKVALITGAGTGVGRACMNLFSAEGAKVVGVSRTQSNLDETLRLVKAAGGEGLVVAADLSKGAGAEKAISATLDARRARTSERYFGKIGWRRGRVMRSRLPPHRNPHLSTSDQQGFTHLRAAAATHPSATRDLTNVRVIFPVRRNPSTYVKSLMLLSRL